jgi:peptidoglycan/LPS O-acetylase OafA/YrhL
MNWYARWAGARDRELHYRPDLDGLRGISILAVLGFHAFPSLVPGGFVGVDVFFVISGFLIATIVLKQLQQSTFTLVDFYVRRVRRLFPALVIVLAACLLFGWFALLPDEFRNLGKHIGAAAAFVLNFAVWREGGYFDSAANLNPVLHLWSLGIEEQFYLLWPVILLLLWRRRRSLMVTTGALIAVSFAANIVFSHTDPRGDFYLPVTRFWELGLGSLLAIRGGAEPDAGSRPPPRAALSVVGLALLGGSALLLDSRVAFPGWAALLPVSGALCLIHAPPDSWFQRRILASGPLVFVGMISYPLYLWHWPLLSFATILGSGTVPTAVRAAAVALSFVLAYTVFRFVELPIRSRSPLHVSNVWVSGLGTLGIAGLVVYAASGMSARFGHDVRSLKTASRTNRYCPEEPGDRSNFNYCKGTSAAPPEVVFLGDSRTQAVYDGMVSLTGRRYPMMLLARGGCPPMLSSERERPDDHRVSCDKTWSAFVSQIRELKPRVVVIVGGGSDQLDGADEDFKDGLRDLIAALKKTASVIYVRETPSFDTGPACFLRSVKVPWGHCSPVMTRTDIEQRLASYNRVLDELETEFPGLLVVDSIPALCGTKFCAQKLRSGEILYRDPLHLTAAGARHLDRDSGLAAVIDAVRASGFNR